MLEQDLVSVITPLFNGESFINETVKSILDQTYKNWELIIVDDASTDNSVLRAEKIAGNDPRINIVKLAENKGAAYCRNLATTIATGNYIAFLDADDLWHPEKLSIQLEFMKSHNCCVSFTNYLHISENGTSLGKRVLALPILTFKKQHSNNYIGNLTGIYKSEEIGKILAPNIRKRQDWAVWLEAIKKSGKPALGIQQDLAYYRVRKGSISSNKLNLIKYNYKFYREYLGYNSVKSSYYMILFFWEYFMVRPKYIQDL